MCLYDALCSISFNLICNINLSVNVLTSPQGSRVCKRTEYVLA